MTRRSKSSIKKRKRERRSPEEARQLILDAATRVLSRQGPEGTRLRDVAREAGVSHALVTHYFGSYEALVDAAVFASLRTVRTSLIERLLVTEQPTPEAIAQQYLDAGLSGDHGRLFAWALFNDERRARLAEQLQPDMQLIATGIELMLQRRTDPPIPRRLTEAVIVALWSMVVGYTATDGFFWAALGRAPGPERDADLREAIGLLARALSPGEA